MKFFKPNLEVLEDRMALSASNPDIPTLIALGSSNGTVTIQQNGADTVVHPYLGFNGVVHAAFGDLNGDGFTDFATVANGKEGQHVKVFDGRTLAEISSFIAFPGWHGAVFITTGDVIGHFDGHTVDLVLLATGQGSNDHTLVYNGPDLSLVQSFYAFDKFDGRVEVQAGYGGLEVWAILTDGTLHHKAFENGVLTESELLPAGTPIG